MSRYKENVKELRVNLGERSYPIMIGPQLNQRLPDILLQLGVETSQKLLVITDENVNRLYGQGILRSVQIGGFQALHYPVPATEQSKSLTQYENIMTYMIEHQYDRKSIILAFGGGVVGDLAGFVASTFMRGISFIQLPTTVLAHDSSVGGKVAINHPLGKNMIGAFHQPKAVIYDTELLRSLPEREVRSGFAELLKLGFIWDHSFATWLGEHVESCLSLQEPYLTQALYTGCQIKAQIVSQDERENGIRALLNFGHTFGHALETLGQYTVFTHGEAVSVGMLLASDLSERIYGQKGLKDAVYHLLDQYQLPTSFPSQWSADEILSIMSRDKKVKEGKLNLILLKEMGQGVVQSDVPPQIVKDVITAHHV